MILGSACVGLFLGWQAMVVLVPATVMIGWLLWPLGRLVHVVARIPATAWLAISTLGWILLWARLVERWPILG